MSVFMDDDTQSTSSLPSTVRDITAECPKFRILVIGKTGCGKSSLVNNVFNVDNIAQVSHKGPGKCDINCECSPADNSRFILHDSEGFEPGEKVNFEIVENFIKKRRQEPLLKDRLHAIWICSSVPLANDRVTETGLERIIKLVRGDVPLIFVFTKYDLLVTSVIRNASDAIARLNEEETWVYGDKEADKAFKRLCSRLQIGNVPITRVSAQSRFRKTISQLIETTDIEIQRHIQDSSYSQPASLAWATAQRGNLDIKVKASIAVGQKRYWSGLIASTDFTGKELRRCLDTIHYDIVSIWNIRDSNNYLAGEDFKARISGVVDNSMASLCTPTSDNGLTLASVARLTMIVNSNQTSFSIAVASVGSAVVFAKWVFDVYRNTPSNIACVMGYIVNLTVVLHRLFTLHAREVTEEHVVSILEDYAKAREITQIHHDIREFVNSSVLRLVGKDYVLDEIIRLIEMHVEPQLK